MAYLTKLTISSVGRRLSSSPAESRRVKLLAKLDEQLAMATAFVEGKPFCVMRKVWGTNQEDGSRHKIEREKRLNAWYWQDGADKYLFEVRYGAQTLELAKGKRAIEVGDKSKLINVINTVIEAVKGGELDMALSSVIATKAESAKTKS